MISIFLIRSCTVRLPTFYVSAVKQGEEDRHGFKISMVQGRNNWDVTLASAPICAFKGSTVVIPCTYTYPSRMDGIDLRVQDTFWFTKMNGNQYVDLKSDPDYSGRVEYSSNENNCTLKIISVRESDSAVYKFRFTTNKQGGSYTGEGVSLTITVFQVQVEQVSTQAVLKCHSSRTLPDKPSYVWYKNGVEMFGITSFRISADINSSYSCAFKGDDDQRSTEEWVQGWSVTFPSSQICAVKGSTVVIPCSITYPSRVNGIDTRVEETFWSAKINRNQRVDLKSDQNYLGRVEYLSSMNICTLRLIDVRLSDSAEYWFGFKTNQAEESVTSSSGVSLSVTDLQVLPKRIQNQVELTCHSSCNPADNPSYVWYQNGWRESEGTTTLRVSFNDNNRYSCAFKGQEEYRSPEVYAPQVCSDSRSPTGEIRENSQVTLSCSCDVYPAPEYTWYKEYQREPLRNTSHLIFSSIQSSDAGRYYCRAKNELGEKLSSFISVDVKYAPKPPSVSVSLGEVVEGSSVTLTCSSNANPAATYTWYKTTQYSQSASSGKQLYLRSIKASDSGDYYCTARNYLGEKSGSISIDVKYAPKWTIISVNPPGEIVEGSLVTLTCSSVANPAAVYTWYKKDRYQTIRWPIKEPQLEFSSIESSDSAEYSCEAENKLGKETSEWILIDVKFAPKPPSLLASPSAIIEEGQSVTLTCSSDANPPANYTWYKENEDSPKAAEQIYTISNARSEHSGNYVCATQNTRGYHNSTIHLSVMAAGAWRVTTSVTVPAILLTIILIFVFIWIIKRRASKQPSEPGERADNSEQIQPSEQQDELHYATVHFNKNLTEPVYSNIQPTKPKRHKQQKEDEMVEYAMVKFHGASTVQSAISQEALEDPAALYSTVNKPNKTHGRSHF
ncbi:sialoadhesin-like isoform X2 [Cheilinus undulatus]|uniref:sialoadhesin-like isoform X2 n=1 Tax=Cheilinus undulatus TaxID=241271 RepID=UPI001BD330C5|nr:sialoadhesin-like isoform X2 [Cheilinus undulatus]